MARSPGCHWLMIGDVQGQPCRSSPTEQKACANMLDQTTDEDGIYLKKTNIDRSVGYIIAGVVVLLFFLMVIVGMGRIEHLSDGAATSNRFTPEEKVPEIGDVEGDVPKD